MCAYNVNRLSSRRQIFGFCINGFPKRWNTRHKVRSQRKRAVYPAMYIIRLKGIAVFDLDLSKGFRFVTSERVFCSVFVLQRCA